MYKHIKYYLWLQVLYSKSKYINILKKPVNLNNKEAPQVLKLTCADTKINNW